MDNLEPKSEELDQEFLQELNTLTKQLKTDEEIQKDIKSKQNPSKIDKEKIKQENKINENPFQEAFDKMNSNHQNSLGFENIVNNKQLYINAEALKRFDFIQLSKEQKYSTLII